MSNVKHEEKIREDRETLYEFKLKLEAILLPTMLSDYGQAVIAEIKESFENIIITLRSTEDIGEPYDRSQDCP